MMPRTRGSRLRREPTQRRSRQTVEAVLDAVLRILKREGLQAVTTNHIAEVAGVSIGSVYQYFPDKQAIFSALHQRHVQEIDRLVESTLVRHANASLEDLVGALMEALIEAHAMDPELHELLTTQVPHRTHGSQDFATRLRGIFRLAIASKDTHLKSRGDIEKVVFVVANMVDALSHAVVLHRPAGLAMRELKDEGVGAVMAYLRAKKD